MSFTYRRLVNKKSLWHIEILTEGYVQVTLRPKNGKLKLWVFTNQNQISESTLPKTVKKCCHNAFYELGHGGIV